MFKAKTVLHRWQYKADELVHKNQSIHWDNRVDQYAIFYKLEVETLTNEMLDMYNFCTIYYCELLIT